MAYSLLRLNARLYESARLKLIKHILSTTEVNFQKMINPERNLVNAVFLNRLECVVILNAIVSSIQKIIFHICPKNKFNTVLRITIVLVLIV